MDLSIAICTYNNARFLQKALNSIAQMHSLNANCNQILVVDNNSTDHTRQIVSSFQSKLGNLVQYVFEPKQGISNARNRAVQESTGEWIAFIDDDILLIPQWLQCVKKALASWNPHCVTGKIIPSWAIKKPRWVTPNVAAALGARDYGDTPFKISSVIHETGAANLLVRKAIFDHHEFRFKPYLKSGEDTDLFLHLLKKGYAIWYNPDQLAFHTIRAERISVPYVLRWNFSNSMSKVFLTRRYPNVYGKSVLGSRMLEKLLKCLLQPNRHAVELLAGGLFSLGLLYYKLRLPQGLSTESLD